MQTSDSGAICMDAKPNPSVSPKYCQLPILKDSQHKLYKTNKLSSLRNYLLLDRQGNEKGTAKTSNPLVKGFVHDNDDEVMKITKVLKNKRGGEETRRTHYSTILGAYFSGFREANKLLKH
ncbi:hypothetical protein F2Q69_00024174 [Brassica cretica]|uniref:Uncharacterized protein n=1 Tax=Brassica cretica TaxID=69181 RepID=A0A8S9QDE4_BRACR|nr:hypothetical protein F2Q69_00024174 [Brassica cretica]